MALPVAKYPIYNIVVPSTGQEIKFRPFLVKEQKIILQAIEFKAADQFINSILGIIDSCTFNKLDVSKLTVYDVDFLFLHIRARSIGEHVGVVYKCLAIIEKEDEDTGEYSNEICDTKINVNLDLTKIKVVTPSDFEQRKLIMVDDNLGLTMKSPNFENYKKLDKVDNVGKMFSVTERFIFDCCANIFDEKGVMLPVKDFTLGDFMTFLDDLPTNAVQDINEFFKSMPHISLDVNVKCPRCGSVDHIELRSLDDFLV